MDIRPLKFKRTCDVVKDIRLQFTSLFSFSIHFKMLLSWALGTGCGLLSLYAAEAGADVIKALEVFGPVAHIARDIFNDSQYADRIELITERSTDLNGTFTKKTGPHRHMHI